jgi:hypothetical protein
MTCPKRNPHPPRTARQGQSHRAAAFRARKGMRWTDRQAHDREGDKDHVVCSAAGKVLQLQLLRVRVEHKQAHQELERQLARKEDRRDHPPELPPHGRRQSPPPPTPTPTSSSPIVLRT